MMSSSSELQLAATNQFLIIREEDEHFIVESLPNWLRITLGIEERLPLRVASEQTKGHILAPFLLVGAQLITQRVPISDYLVETQDAQGHPLAILVQGHPEANLSFLGPGLPAKPGAVLAGRDVTGLLMARRKTAAIGAFHGIVGQSLSMLEVYHKIATYGPTDAAVIITGETGTGKELIARAIHERSKREKGPFVAVNCVALTSELFESELFGHEKGSFTGAIRQHRGRFQRADGGTLFLDEIGDMPLQTQAKMLRALEEGVVERIGSEKEERVDVRVVAATNVALEQAVSLRRFRADLYHRLSVLRIHIPALRDRQGDLPLLVDHYLQIFNRRYDRNIRRLTPEALDILESWHWPGNVRELRNVMERLVIESAGEAITARHLGQWVAEREYVMPGNWNADEIYSSVSPIITPMAPMSGAHRVVDPAGDPPRAGDAFWGRRGNPMPRSLGMEPPDDREIVEAAVLPPQASEPTEPVELTEALIRASFSEAGGNLTKAARKLGIHKATLYRHMTRLGLTRESLGE